MTEKARPFAGALRDFSQIVCRFYTLLGCPTLVAGSALYVSVRNT